jgi:hypothetical protein
MTGFKGSSGGWGGAGYSWGLMATVRALAGSKLASPAHAKPAVCIRWALYIIWYGSMREVA